jgi:hypothetical protein
VTRGNVAKGLTPGIPSVKSKTTTAHRKANPARLKGGRYEGNCGRQIAAFSNRTFGD